MKADTRSLSHWLPECCSSARVVLLVWVRLPLTCWPAYLKMWWACRRACFKTLPLPVCLHGSAVLEARGVLEEGHGSCNAYVKVCTAATARTWAFLENVWDFILRVVLQVGLFPGGDPRDREKTRMVPHCRNPIFLQTFSLWAFKKVFFCFVLFFLSDQHKPWNRRDQVTSNMFPSLFPAESARGTFTRGCFSQCGTPPPPQGAVFFDFFLFRLKQKALFKAAASERMYRDVWDGMSRDILGTVSRTQFKSDLLIFGK